MSEKIYPAGYRPVQEVDEDISVRNQLLDAILKSGSGQMIDSDLFSVMANRRSTRKFKDVPVEPSKVDKIIAAADTAPTAGNFQGFEILYVRDAEKKKRLVAACNNQPYVNAPTVLVFCKNSSRVFPRLFPKL